MIQNSPSIYNGSSVYESGVGGVYNGRGIYKFAEQVSRNIVVVEYFNKLVGMKPTAKNAVEYNYIIDSTCPLNIPGGAPVLINGKSVERWWNNDHINNLYNGGEFTISFYAKSMSQEDQGKGQRGPLFIRRTEDYWNTAFSFNSSGRNNCVLNNSASYFSQNHTVWRKYEIAAKNKTVRFFVDGVLKHKGTLNADSVQFSISSLYQGRPLIYFAEVALLNNCLHDSDANFTPDYEPIAY